MPLDGMKKKESRWCEAILAELDGDGYVDPEFLVNRAKKSSHPLHGAFEWDDSKAAHLHRVEQARKLLRKYVVVKKTASGPRRVRMFVNVDYSQKKWAHVDDVLADQERVEAWMGIAYRELLALKRKYETLLALNRPEALEKLDEILDALKGDDDGSTKG